MAEHPEPPKDLCTAREKICDFKRDCDNGDDEAKCGEYTSPLLSVLTNQQIFKIEKGLWRFSVIQVMVALLFQPKLTGLHVFP